MKRWVFACVFSIALVLAQVVPVPGGAPRAQPAESELSSLRLSFSGGLPDAGQIEVSLHRRLVASDGLERYHRLVATTAPVSRSLELRVPDGEYLLIAHAEGFVRVVRGIQVHDDTAVAVPLVAARSSNIRVVVDRDGERRPLMGASVLLSDEGPLPWGNTTDASGQVTFDDLPQGPLLVRIFAPGFRPYRAYVDGDLLVKMEPSSVAVIRVERSGEPAPGAEVILSGAQLWPTRSVLCNDDGRVEVTGLSPGRYSVYARSGEYVSAVRDDLTIRDAPGRQEITLELVQGSFVTVVTRAASDRRFIEGARVSLGASGLGQFVLHGSTDSDGVVKLGPLLEIRGLLQADAPGFVPRTVPIDSERGPQGDLTPSAQMQPALGERRVEIELLAAGQVAGRVVDADGFPIEGAIVEAVGVDRDGMPYAANSSLESVRTAHFDWARGWQSSPRRRLIPAGELGVMVGPVPPIPLADLPTSVPAGSRLATDRKGNFVIAGVPPGKGVVLVRHDEYLDGRSEEFSLLPGARITTQIVLQRGDPLRGRVVDHRGFPVAAARINVTSREFDKRVLTEDDGQFRLAAAPRRVTLRVFDPVHPLRVLWSEEVVSEQRDQPQKIVLPPPREPARVIVRERSGPVGLAQVTMVSLDPSLPFKKTKFTSNEGSVEFDDAEGLRVRLIVSKVGYSERRIEQILPEVLGVSLEPTLTVRVKVTGVRGRHRAAGAAVRLESTHATVRATADELGWATLKDAPPGPALLVAEHPDYGRGSRAVDLQSTETGRPVELADLDLLPTSVVRGVVVDPDGLPLPNAWVGTQRVGAFRSFFQPGPELVQADEEGRFTIEVEPRQSTYLYAGVAGRAFGFSDPFDSAKNDRLEDLRVLVDHPDRAPSHVPATVLLTIEDRDPQYLVYAVAAGSAAQEAGLQPGDRILSVDGAVPATAQELRDLLSGSAGTEVRLVIGRLGRELPYIVAREPFVRGK